jgi:hypothetical protein
MGEDLLKKVKGFSSTSVFYSNTNTYASAAIAGMMAVRSQEIGRYFRVSDTFIPMLDALGPEELNSVPDRQSNSSIFLEWPGGECRHE